MSLLSRCSLNPTLSHILRGRRVSAPSLLSQSSSLGIINIKNNTCKASSLIRKLSTTKEIISSSSSSLSSLSSSSSSSSLLSLQTNELIISKIYRWIDITGVLTRWNNRKEWVLDLDPFSRIGAVMMTEYERKLLMFLGFHAYLFSILSIIAWVEAQKHIGCKPPCPKSPEYSYLDGRKKDFTWHSKMFFINPKERCKECRWLDSECKKICFDRLKEEGNTLIFNNGKPLSTPRQKLLPLHN